MNYSIKRSFVFIAFILSCGLALALSLPHQDLVTELDEIGIDILLMWGLPLISIFVLQAGNHLIQKKNSDFIYISLFSIFWLVSAFSVIIDELY